MLRKPHPVINLCQTVVFFNSASGPSRAFTIPSALQIARAEKQPTMNLPFTTENSFPFRAGEDLVGDQIVETIIFHERGNIENWSDSFTNQSASVASSTFDNEL